MDLAAAAVIVAAVAAESAAAVTAAAEQQDQNNDPPAVIPTKTVTAHKKYLRIKIFEQLHRSFHGIPQRQKGAWPVEFFGRHDLAD